MRRASISDLQSLVKLEQLSFAQDAFNRRQFRYLLTSSTAEIYVMEDEVQLIGSIILLFRKNCSHSRIYSISVHPEHRKKGIGDLLLKHVETETLSRRKSLIQLEVRKGNERAINFYLRNGYFHIRNIPSYYPDGEDGEVYQKRLEN